jgi:hypothetical protein
MAGFNWNWIHLTIDWFKSWSVKFKAVAMVKAIAIFKAMAMLKLPWSKLYMDFKRSHYFEDSKTRL